MKNLILFLLMFSFLGSLPACKKIQEKRNPKISGRVLDYYTRQPLANAKVLIGVIRDADYYSALDSVTTDENGYYEITSEPKFGKDYDFENDHFIVSAKKEGYEKTFANKSFDGFDEFYINVKGSVNTEFKNLYLRKEITINVRAIDLIPYQDYNSDKKNYVFIFQKKENQKLEFYYPPLHKTLNQTNWIVPLQLDTFGITKYIVPFAQYSVDVILNNPSDGLPFTTISSETIDPNSLPDTLIINF